MEILHEEFLFALHFIVFLHQESAADNLGTMLWNLECKIKVAIICANALNLVISNMSATIEKAVIEAPKLTEISISIVGNIGFLEIDSLMITILFRWPSYRFCF
ncbi:hypothetical protein MTR_2g073720 [Medicago truncatula]|uniref:At1g04390 ARM repeat domain-containing protein n=1 Tax=Medicago truncatula TaxID=3880 RepID=A0A072VAX0_MEDTR|nr:hypothetical protein MTR_2g073720 [Medicago truncatula]